MADTKSVKRSPLGRVFALLIGLVAAVILSEIVLRIGMTNWREFHSGRLMATIHVPGFGPVATGRPGFNGFFAQNNGDFRVHVAINGFGLRNAEPVETADGQVWTMGDSMTFGFGVEANETYTERLEKMIGPGVYNFAGPGNDVCGYQIMANRIPPGLKPRAVIVGLFLENDVDAYDCPARFKAEGAGNLAPAGENGGFTLKHLKLLLTEYSALYNFTTVSLKRVDFLTQALMAMGLITREHAERDHPPEGLTPELTKRTAIEIRRLRDHYPAETPFAVLMIPARHEIRDGSTYYGNLRIAVHAAIMDKDVTVIDPFPALKKAGFQAVHFTHDGHWSAKGHEIAARAAAEWLRGAGIGN